MSLEISYIWMRVYTIPLSVNNSIDSERRTVIRVPSDKDLKAA